jgi:hypothetical protein
MRASSSGHVTVTICLYMEISVAPDAGLTEPNIRAELHRHPVQQCWQLELPVHGKALQSGSEITTQLATDE